MLPNGSYKINNVAFPAQYVDMASDGTTVTGYQEDNTAAGENHRTVRMLSLMRIIYSSMSY
jgi:hypothetical protein